MSFCDTSDEIICLAQVIAWNAKTYRNTNCIVQAGRWRRRDGDGGESKFFFSVAVKFWFSLGLLGSCDPRPKEQHLVSSDLCEHTCQGVWVERLGLIMLGNFFYFITLTQDICGKDNPHHQSSPVINILVQFYVSSAYQNSALFLMLTCDWVFRPKKTQELTSRN